MEMIQATYLWGSKPRPLGNTNWAGNTLAVIVNTQICKVKGRDGMGGAGAGLSSLPRLGRGRRLTRVWVCPAAKIGQGEAFDQRKALPLHLAMVF